MSEKVGSENELEELERADSWDFEKAVVHPSSKANRIVVSVSFPRASFEDVTKCADCLGVRVSEFIREAARDKATRQAEVLTVGFVSGSFTGVITTHGNVWPATSNIPRITGAKPLAADPIGKQSGFVNEPTTV